MKIPHIIYVMLVLILFITSCDEPKTSEIQKPLQKETTEVPIDNGDTPSTDKKDTTTAEEEEAPAEYTFAFAKKEHKKARTTGTYTYTTITETNKAEDDTRDIRYTSSNTNIATVNTNTGTVTFVTAGTVIITATKPTADELKEVSDSYTLYITMKPADKLALVAEIKTAMQKHGDEVDLNYIDTSAITDMSQLFNVHIHGLGSFNGDISKWRVGKVTNMYNMFSEAREFNGDISRWDVSSVTTMDFMFSGNAKFNGDLSRWDVSNVTSMNSMFVGAKKFNQNLDCWADRIHRIHLKQDNARYWHWANAKAMFDNSKLVKKNIGGIGEPSWYRRYNLPDPPADCKPVNPKDPVEEDA